MRARACLMALAIALSAGPAGADEIWVAPTAQQDFGGIGIGIGSSSIWASTIAGVVRLAWGVPGNLQTFQSAKIVLIPQATVASTTLFVLACRAQNAELVIGSPTTGTDHIVGLRFAYAPVIPANTATLGSNVFTGTQTAATFVGSGADLTGVAKLSANTFMGTQTLTDGNLVLGAGDIDLDASGEITKDGKRFLHNIGINSIYAGVDVHPRGLQRHLARPGQPGPR